MQPHAPTQNAHTSPPWFPANLPALDRRFQRHDPQDVLRWALVTFGDDGGRLALATGFGLSGIVLIHMVAGMRPGSTFFYLQTDLLFPETMALRDRLAAVLPIRFREVPASLALSHQSRRYGPELWKHNPDLCCHLRKVAPLQRFLAGRRAWVTGIRRDQSPTRAGTRVVDWDQANGLLKIAPLAHWTRQQVWDYVRANDLPYNPLHDEGYPSIGCVPCTRPVATGGHERDGRWAGRNKLECGIHSASNITQQGPGVVWLVSKANVTHET